MRNLAILIKVRMIKSFNSRMRKRKKGLPRDIMSKMLKLKEKNNYQRRKRQRKRNLRKESKQIMNDTMKLTICDCSIKNLLFFKTTILMQGNQRMH